MCYNQYYVARLRNIDMAKRKEQLANGEIYHVLLRGVDGKTIFNDEQDYYRAIHDIFEFNDEALTVWQHRHSLINKDNKSTDKLDKSDIVKIEKEKKPRKLLVEVLAFCLMPNHIHLLLRQVKDRGITKFMGKFGTGYAVYFNNKNQRSGHLFQGRFKAILIKTNSQLQKIFVYIHTNPASLVDSQWKKGGIKDPNKIIDQIENYKWGSYSDYLGKKNFPSLTQRDFLNQVMTKEEWQKFVNQWVEFKDDKWYWEDVDLE